MENPANNLGLAFNEKEKPGSLRKCSAWSPGMSVHNSPSLSVLPREVREDSLPPPKTQRCEPKHCLRHEEFNTTVPWLCCSPLQFDLH